MLRAALVLTTGLALAACSNSSSATTTTTDSPATVLFNAGLTAEQHGGYRQATNDFGGVLQLQPRSYLADYDLGVADAALKRTSAAKAAYGRAIAIAPSFRSALYNLALLDSSIGPRSGSSPLHQARDHRPGRSKRRVQLSVSCSSAPVG